MMKREPLPCARPRQPPRRGGELEETHAPAPGASAGGRLPSVAPAAPWSQSLPVSLRLAPPRLLHGVPTAPLPRNHRPAAHWDLCPDP